MAQSRSSMIRGLLLVVFVLCSLLIGCATAQKHYEDTHGAVEREMTVGVAQREIRKGMSADQVAAALGSPNIVTTDSEGREVWIYDKISTDVTYSKDKGSLLIYGKSAGGRFRKLRQRWSLRFGR